MEITKEMFGIETRKKILLSRSKLFLVGITFHGVELEMLRSRRRLDWR